MKKKIPTCAVTLTQPKTKQEKPGPTSRLGPFHSFNSWNQAGEEAHASSSYGWYTDETTRYKGVFSIPFDISLRKALNNEFWVGLHIMFHEETANFQANECGQWWMRLNLSSNPQYRCFITSCHCLYWSKVKHVWQMNLNKCVLASSCIKCCHGFMSSAFQFFSFTEYPVWSVWDVSYSDSRCVVFCLQAFLLTVFSILCCNVRISSEYFIFKS